MSVLMRGVDMPKNCEECNFKGECRNYWEKIREAYTRPSWCPLVEVEPMKTTDYCAICKQDMCKDCIADATNPYCVPSHYEMKQAEPKTDNGIGCSKCESRFWCMDRDMPHAVHCNNYGKVTDEPQTEVETMSCAECKHRPIGAEICEEACHYEPQTDWHYDEQDATWYPYKHETEPQQKSCATCKHALGNWDGESNNCGRCCGADRRFYEPKTEPQTDSLEQFRVGLEYHTDTTHFGKVKGESITTNKVEDKPQTDGYMTAEQAEDYRKMLDKAEHKVYGNIEDEPQTNADQHVQHVGSVETMSCQECKYWIFDDRWGWFCPLKSHDECRYEPKDEPQTEREGE